MIVDSESSNEMEATSRTSEISYRHQHRTYTRENDRQQRRGIISLAITHMDL